MNFNEFTILFYTKKVTYVSISEPRIRIRDPDRVPNFGYGSDQKGPDDRIQIRNTVYKFIFSSVLAVPESYLDVIRIRYLKKTG
jgi:hypothetical protein